MLSTTHLVSGAAIGTVASSPLEIIVYSILFHFLLDLIPHWDPNFEKNRKFFLIASIDLLVGLLLAFYLVGKQLDHMVLLAMAFSILPDVVTFFILMPKKQLGTVYVDWHKMIQNNSDDWGGILSQLIVLIIMSGVILI